MTIHITPEITAAFELHLDEVVDTFVDGRPIKRRHTYPYSDGSGIVGFAAGWQAATEAAAKKESLDAKRWRMACPTLINVTDIDLAGAAVMALECEKAEAAAAIRGKGK